MTVKIAKKIKERIGWIYECRFLSKKIDERLYPNWDWAYYKKHFYRSDDNYDHFVFISARHRTPIFKATQHLANKLLGFERPWWYFAKQFYIGHHTNFPCRPPEWYRPRSYKYRLKADIRNSARSYVRNPEKDNWVFSYYSEDHPEWFTQFDAEVERQKRILAKA